jgi:hypothetical protein
MQNPATMLSMTLLDDYNWPKLSPAPRIVRISAELATMAGFGSVLGQWVDPCYVLRELHNAEEHRIGREKFLNPQMVKVLKRVDADELLQEIHQLYEELEELCCPDLEQEKSIRVGGKTFVSCKSGYIILIVDNPETIEAVTLHERTHAWFSANPQRAQALILLIGECGARIPFQDVVKGYLPRSYYEEAVVMANEEALVRVLGAFYISERDPDRMQEFWNTVVLAARKAVIKTHQALQRRFPTFRHLMQAVYRMTD